MTQDNYSNEEADSQYAASSERLLPFDPVIARRTADLFPGASFPNEAKRELTDLTEDEKPLRFDLIAMKRVADLFPKKAQD